MKKLLERFDVVGQAGIPQALLRFQWIHHSQRVRDPLRLREPGDVYLALRGGGDVAQIDPDTFKVVSTGELLRRTKPAGNDSTRHPSARDHLGQPSLLNPNAPKVSRRKDA